MTRLNEGLRFLLETGFIAVAFVYGCTLGSNLIASLGAGVFLGAVVIALWGAFAAPQRKYPTPSWFPSFMFVVFSLLAVAALVALGHPLLAGIFAMLALVNEVGLRLGVGEIDRAAPPR